MRLTIIANTARPLKHLIIAESSSIGFTLRAPREQHR
jgi:hypothetical protein